MAYTTTLLTWGFVLPFRLSLNLLWNFLDHNTIYPNPSENACAYRADKAVPALARGTTLHQLIFQFKGTELFRCEQIAEEPM